MTSSSETAVSKYNFHVTSETAALKTKARLLFEDLVATAEKKYIELRNAKVAEYETMPLVDFKRNPSQVFNKEEIKQLYDVSGCNDFSVRANENCSEKLYHHLYRSIDGFCNNVEHPEYGTTASELRRLVPADYENGISSPRGHSQAVCNQPDYLFNADSKQCNSDECMKGDAGNAIDHDFLYDSPVLNDPCDGVSGSFDLPLPSPNYITSKLRLGQKPLKLPLSDWSLLWGQFIINDIINIPNIEDGLFPGCEPCESNAACDLIRQFNNNDTHVPFESTSCQSIRRSAVECIYRYPGGYPPRNQLNDVTAFLDGSVVYSSTVKQASNLRTFKQGTLIESFDTSTLPLSAIPGGTSHCDMSSNGGWLCGDYCCLGHDPVTSLHIIFVRFHNSLAKQLSELNPEWNDEAIYQETRKIISAVIQKITYQNFLPKLFSGDIFNHLLGHYKGYDNSVNPQVSVAFSDIILMGLVYPNHVYDSEFQKNLFSIVIQRGREHGLPNYSKYREYIEKYSPLTPLPKIDSSFLSVVNELYGSLDNVDLVVGALGEMSMTTPLGRTSLFGATFASIIALTFKNLRDGDRFFYRKSGIFTSNQLEQIDKIEIVSLICNFGDSVSIVSSDAFLKNFEMTDCNHYSGKILDLSHWQDQVCHIKVALIPPQISFVQVVGISITDRARIRAVYISDVYDQACLPVICPINEVAKSSVNFITFLNTNDLRECEMSTSFSQFKIDKFYLNITLIPSMINRHLIHRTQKSCKETRLSTIKWKCPANLTALNNDFTSIPLPPEIELSY